MLSEISVNELDHLGVPSWNEGGLLRPLHSEKSLYAERINWSDSRVDLISFTLPGSLLLWLPDQPEQVLREQTLENEDQLACVVAELEDSLRDIPGVRGMGSFTVTGLEAWEWERKTPRER